MLQPAKIDIYVLRAPIETPVKTAFGTMHDRPAVLVRLEDTAGAYGWGEAWCNFPGVGAEHRAALIETVLGPLLRNRSFATPADLFNHLTSSVEVLSIQSGEPGPLAQSIAALDIAGWDLYARRQGVPLCRLLSPGAVRSVPAYASGIDPLQMERVIARSRNDGFAAFKLKVGFGRTLDRSVLAALQTLFHPAEQVMLDANQAWDITAARSFLRQLDGASIGWLEEPIRADSPTENWQLLRREAGPPIAAGENLRGAGVFRRVIQEGLLDVVQPDACKWGGVSAVWPVAQATVRAGLVYCPHSLGAGIGLLASAHLLAAAGGPGLLEVDVNPNPLRFTIFPGFSPIRVGQFDLPSGDGLGIEPDRHRIAEFLVDHRQLTMAHSVS